jgi:hypothetical protein
MTITLTSIVRCELLGLDKKIQDTCFGYVFSKACQYVRTNEKVCKNLRVFFCQNFLLVKCVKCITWCKKFGKDRQEWKKACLNSNIHF